MTTMSWFLVWALIYLVVGIVLKNHTRIETVQFKDYSTRFIIFYIIPLGGVLFFVVSNVVYVLTMIISEMIFGNLAMSSDSFFKDLQWPEYPKRPSS